MGAYLQGEKLEFNKRKYNVKETVLNNIYKFDSTGVPTTSGYLNPLLYSETVALKFIVKEIFACSELTVTDVQQISNIDMSKIDFVLLGVYAETARVSDASWTDTEFLSNSDTPGIIQINKSYDSENFYISFTIDKTKTFNYGDSYSDHRANRIYAIVGYFTYESKYIVDRVTSGQNNVVFNNDVYSSGSTQGFSSGTGATVIAPTNYPESISKEINTTISSYDIINRALSALNTYALYWKYGTISDSQANQNGKSAKAYNLRLELNNKITSREITHVISS